METGVETIRVLVRLWQQDIDRMGQEELRLSLWAQEQTTSKDRIEVWQANHP
jgi:hypothetical protein